jgi:hypothetical protein
LRGDDDEDDDDEEGRGTLSAAVEADAGLSTIMSFGALGVLGGSS